MTRYICLASSLTCMQAGGHPFARIQTTSTRQLRCLSMLQPAHCWWWQGCSGVGWCLCLMTGCLPWAVPWPEMARREVPALLGSFCQWAHFFFFFFFDIMQKMHENRTEQKRWMCRAEVIIIIIFLQSQGLKKKNGWRGRVSGNDCITLLWQYEKKQSRIYIINSSSLLIWNLWWHFLFWSWAMQVVNF